LKKFLILFLLLAQPAFAGVLVLQGAPSGFEQLEAPKKSIVSLYYGGGFLGNFSIHMTPSSIKFDNPQEIIKAIPAINKPDDIARILQQDMPVHAGLQCTAKKTIDCGKLSPEIAGVIFNENTLTGELFINAHYLSITDNDAQRYLPLPEKKLSSVAMFNGAVSGVDGQNNFTLANDSIVSFGENKLNASSSVSNNGLRFDTMEMSRERDGWETGGGLFRSRSMQLAGDVDMAGVSVATSMHTVLDKDKNVGNDVLIFLPRRSFVSIYREGRLYSSRAYEAGNQLIDTSELPEGAYNITLRIQEADGSTREEQRFFAKNEDIPPPGHPVYYAQGGVVRKPAEDDSTLPQITDKPIMRVGTVRRMNDAMGWSLGATGIQDRAAAESGIFWLKESTQLHLNALTSTAGDMGVNANYLYIRERMSAALDLRRMWSGNLPDVDYQTIFTDLKQISATTSWSMRPDVTIGTRASYSQQKYSPSSLTIGPYAQWRIWQRGESTLEFNADFARINGENQGDVLLRFTHRMGDYGVTGTAGQGYGANGGAIGSVRGYYEKNQPSDYLNIGAGASTDRNSNTVSTDADYRNDFGQVRGSMQQNFGRDGNNFGYGGNFAVGAAQLADSIHIGGSQNDRSAVIVKTSGDAKTRMKIFVNGSPVSHVDVGKEQVIYLSPYHIYNIRIAPENAGLFNYDVNDRKVTLYEGNVSQQEWFVNNFYVLVGKVVKPDGTPLQNAMLQESRAQVTTNDKGKLQAELSMTDVIHFIGANNQSCEVKLPDNVTPVNGVLLYRKPLVCQPVNQSSSQH
jgi:outer membrane usher protein FimD/PapC